MRKLLLGLGTAALAVTPLIAHAGSAEQPELTDPTGDTRYAGLVPADTPWADLISVWFEDGGGTLDVHIRTAGGLAAPDHDAYFSVDWDVPLSDDLCHVSAAVSAVDADDVSGSDSDGNPTMGPTGSAIVWCDADATRYEVAGHTITVGPDFGETLPGTAAASEGEVVLSLPLGVHRALQADAPIATPFAQSQTMQGVAGGGVSVPVDDTEPGLTGYSSSR